MLPGDSPGPQYQLPHDWVVGRGVGVAAIAAEELRSGISAVAAAYFALLRYFLYFGVRPSGDDVRWLRIAFEHVCHG